MPTSCRSCHRHCIKQNGLKGSCMHGLTRWRERPYSHASMIRVRTRTSLISFCLQQAQARSLLITVLLLLVGMPQLDTA